MSRKSYRSSFEMKTLFLQVLFLLPVLSNGLEMVVGTAKGIVYLKGSGENYTEYRLGEYSLLDVSVSSLAVNMAHKLIFFTRTQSSDGELVQSMQLDQGLKGDPSIKTIIRKAQGPQSIRDLVYDEVRDALYWTDSKKHDISTISIKEAQKGQNATVLHQFGAETNLAGIAIDTCRGLLFWTNDNHRSPSIERSYINGSNAAVIVSNRLFLPVTLSVDSVGGWLFWIDKMEGLEYKIEMSRLDGSERVTLLKGGQQKPYTMSYLPLNSGNTQAGTLLWSDLSNKIWKIAVDDDGKVNKMAPKTIYDFNRTTVKGLVVIPSSDAHQHKTCFEISRVGMGSTSNLAITMPTTVRLEDLSTKAYMSEEPRKENQPLSPLEEPTTQVETTAPTTTGVVERTKPTIPPQDPNPTTKAPRNDSISANSIKWRLQHNNCNYCVNGEPMEDGKGGPVKCKCPPGYSGSRCEKYICDNYCVHGSCSLEQRSDGNWEPNCTCRVGFEGRKCERDPCWGYCLNGRCRIESDGKPKCNCMGNGQQARGKRCELLSNLQQVCALLCSQDSSKTLYSFVPLEEKDNEVGDAERPLCVCPSGTTFVYSTTKGGLNITGERASTESTTIFSPIVLALIGVCIVLLVISLFLTFKVMKLRRLPRIKKRIIVSKGSVPLAAGCSGSRGRSPSAGSPVLGEQQQCEITIENCCNMNICETPCFEPQLRSPGKSGNSKKTTTKEEKKVLLVNMEGPKTSCGPCSGLDELY